VLENIDGKVKKVEAPTIKFSTWWRCSRHK
jgi:hypothetical protein